ncbi:MAG: OB-fold nucleic acid binding domain-containing protein [Candidatus Micrarchaeota archaeon]|nr:OB-fold nucleic acid binding domain-containing protein [Candidatus Micrarchaeota archaeon]
MDKDSQAKVKISELKAGIGNVNVTGEIVSKEEPREVITKFGKKLRVANATLKDDSGEIALSLWGDDADKFSQGDTIQIENGWVSEFKGNPQLSAGKYGKITKL